MKDKINDLIKFLNNKNLTISSAESVTGGKFANLFTSKPGASKYFLGSIISYSNFSKNKLLDISLDKISKYGAVSSQISYDMALNLYKKLNSNISVSFTGNAGPKPMENKSIGLVFITIIYNNNFEQTILDYKFNSKLSSRNEIIDDVINFVIDQILIFLRNKDFFK